MEKYPHHQSLRLQNFTAFQDATFDFVPGINVLIGENGVGKTHVLKILYSSQFARYRVPVNDDFKAPFNRIDLTSTMKGAFQISTPGELMNSSSENFIAIWKLKWNNQEWSCEVAPLFARMICNSLNSAEVQRPVFIPAIDMMGHTKGFTFVYDERAIDFDQTHRDIVALLLAPELRETTNNGDKSMTALAELLGGTVEEDRERFYLNTPQGRQPMPLVAEGLRKIATLYQLYRNGFLRPGATLFWDEPENNLNPILMDEVVRALLALARSGVQIFLATHSYFVLKELDLQAGAEDSVRFFSLEKTDEGTKVHAADDYAQLSPNPIADQFDSIYDRELTRATGRRRRK